MLVSDVTRPDDTWVRGIFELTPRVRPSRTRPLTEMFDYGRFVGHVESSARLLPKVVYQARLGSGALATSGSSTSYGLGETVVTLLATPRGDLLLLLDTRLAGNPDAGQVASFLAATCFQREQITIDDERATRWVARQLGVEEPIRFGRNVHQCVFPGGRLRDRVLAAGVDPLPSEIVAMVYRGTVNTDWGASAIRVPSGMHQPGTTLVAHLRGVSVIAGWVAPVQNILSLAATTYVSALGVLHRARDLAFDALEHSQSAQSSSTGAARELISHLSAQLNEVQLDLSFGVEAYVDSVLVPEVIMEGFQASLREVTGLDTALANTSRMVERLAGVIRGRQAVLDAATQDEQEQRGRLLNMMLAVGSLIALPPGLLLAFFGAETADIDGARSMFDIEQYWLAYGVAWLPFVSLVLVGFVLRRRIRSRTMLANGGTRVVRPGAVPAGTIPAQRPGAVPVAVRDNDNS